MKISRWLLLLLPAFVVSCESEVGDPVISESRSMTVIASNYPLYYFAMRIADGIAGSPVIILPEIEGDPANWVPDAAQIELLQSAALIVLNGAGAESWPDLVTLDPDKFLDTTASVPDQLIPLAENIVHQHGPAGAHSHQGTAFTTWLDPELASIQAAAIAEGLASVDPDHADAYLENLAALQTDMRDLDVRLRTLFQQLDSRPVVFSHPVYQYLARRYQVNGISVHWEPEEAPSTTAWIELQQKLQNHPSTLMVWEGEPLQATVEQLADSGLQSVTFDPAANRPGAGNYLEVMDSNIANLSVVLEDSSR